MSQQVLPLGLTDARIITASTLSSAAGLVVSHNMDTDMVQQVVQPHHMTLDKNHTLHGHMMHDKGQTLNMGSIQRLSLLESWRQQYQGGMRAMKLEQNRTTTECVITDDCDVMYHNRIHGTCSNHGTFTELDPTAGYDSASLKYTPLPVPAQLTVQSSSTPGETLGVFSNVFISKGMRMGPYEGRKMAKEDVDENTSIAYAWEVQHKGNKRFLIDGADPANSNWMRYVKCARHVEEQNIVAYQCHGNIYYCALRNISPKSELLVWYEDKYAKSLGVPLLSEAVVPKFYCQCCGESFVAKKFFHIHLKHSSGCSYTCKTSGNHVNIQDQIKQLEAVVHQSSTLDQIPQLQSTSVHQTCKQEQLDKMEKVIFVCPYCAEHVDHHCYHKNDAHNEQLTCKNCGNSFTQRDVWHPIDHVYSCDHCDKQFSQKKALNLHLKTHSSGQNQCSLCGKVFTRTSNLQRHMRIHSGDRPYSCEHCDKAFRSRSNLQQHLVTHSAVKPFKCEFCGKTFGRVNNLQRHLRIHTGDRPYKCPNCEKTFIQSSHLRKHSRTHITEKS